MNAVFLGLWKAFAAFLIKMLTAMAGEAFIKWLFFYIGQQVVESTKTPHDNEFLAKAKSAYEEYDKK